MKFYERPLFWVCILFILGGFIGWACGESLPGQEATAGAWLQAWLLMFTLHIFLRLRGVRYGEIALIAGEICGFVIHAPTPALPFVPAPYDAFLAGAIITATVLLSILFNTKCLPLLRRWRYEI